MGVRFPSVFSNTLVNASLVANVETVVVTTPVLTLPLDSAVVLIFWYCVHTVGTTATTSRFVLRRGTTAAGNFLGVPAPFTATAGNTVLASGCYFDQFPGTGGGQYSLTGIDPSATAAGAITDAAIIAFSL